MLGSNPSAGPNVDVHVGGSFSGQLAAGSDNTQVALNINVGNQAGETLAFLDRALGIERIDPPVDVRPADFPGLVGRTAAVTLAEQPVAPPWIGIVGDTGFGKTVLLRHLSGRWAVTRQPDGMVYLPTAGMVDLDIAFALFDLFYRTRPRGRPSRGELVAALATVKAVVMLDDVDDAHLADTLSLMRQTTFVVASRSGILSEGTRVPLPGLDAAAAVSLLERGYGRQLRPDERADAERLVTLLHGHPADILREASDAAAYGRTIADLVANLQQTDPSRRPIHVLSEEERSVALAAAALGGVPVGREHLVAVTGQPAAVDELERRGIVRPASPSLVLDRTWLERLSTRPELPEWHSRWLAYFAGWAAGPDATAHDVSVETPALAHLLAPTRFAVDRGGAQRLVRVLVPALTLTSRWGLRRRLLELVVAGISPTDEPGTGAWALHELGTQDVVEGRLTQARENLTTAREIRHRSGDVSGQAATEQNLAVLDALVTPLPVRTADESPTHRTSPAKLSAKLLVPLAAGFLALAAGILVWLLLNAGGTGPSASPRDMTFATWRIGERSPIQTVQITAGSRPIRITSVRIDEVTGFELIGAGCAGVQLLPGGSCTQSVLFAPAREGSAKAALLISIEGSEDPIAVGLSADGTAPSPSLSDVSPAPASVAPSSAPPSAPPSSPPPRAPANLVIQGFDLGEPSHEVDGWHVPVTVVVGNRGESDAPVFEVALLRDVNSTEIVPFVVQGNAGPVPSTVEPLATGREATFIGFALLPPDSGGGMTIDVEADSCAVADPANRAPCRVNETREDDNSFRRPLRLARGPDLVVLRIERANAMPHPDPDGFVWDGSYVAVVRNAGTADSGAAVIGVDVQGGDAKLARPTVNEVRGLAPGEESTVRGAFHFHYTQGTGTPELVLTVDPCTSGGSCRIPELNDQNNTTVQTIDFPTAVEARP